MFKDYKRKEMKVEAFGEDFHLVALSIKDSLELQNKKIKEEDLIFHMIARSVVKPKITVKDIMDLPASAMEELTKLADTVNE